MRNTATAATVYLKDYTVPAFLIPEVELDISLFEDHALVRAKLAVERNREAPAAPLRLDLDELTVESVVLDGTALSRPVRSGRAAPHHCESPEGIRADHRLPDPSQTEH